MAKKSRDDSEPNFDSLMDAVTNVVGVLMIVFVMMALNLADSVRKILSELPPVTEEEHQQIKEELAQIPPPPKTPEQVEEEMAKAEEEKKKVAEQLRSVDVSDVNMATMMDLDEFRKKLETARSERDTEKVEVDKLLAEVERLKALLDETPEYKPEDATVVRLPNPRPYPKEPNETRFMVAKEGVLILDQQEFLAPLMDGLSKVTTQLEYGKQPDPTPFVPMLTKVLGSADNARKAWPDIGPLAGTFQMDDVAKAWKALTAAGFPADTRTLATLGDLTAYLGHSLTRISEAMAALTKGDGTKWASMDPSKDPTKPTIKVSTTPRGYSLTFRNKEEIVENKPRDLMKYFEDLAGIEGVKGRSKSRVIYDAFKIKDLLARAASNQAFTKAFTFEPVVQPGNTLVKLQLTPTAGGGENMAQMELPESNYQRTLRKIAADPNGVALFQVMPDAFATYLEARLIADDNRVAATWETLSKLDITMNINGYTTQRFAEEAAARPRGDTPIIRGPAKTLD